MINGSIEQFLDTGWFSESTLYLNGHIYWCEAQSNFKTHIHRFFVNKWQVINEENKYFHSICDQDGPVDWECVYEDSGQDFDLIKKHFLEAKIFDGKSFWEVEHELAWLDESTPITKDSSISFD